MMKGYKTYNVTLKAITPIVLTQRENQQMISGIDFEIKDGQVKWLEDNRTSTLGKVKDESKISTIYPAYFNGNSYYIPGSTIKGNMMKRAKNIQEEGKRNISEKTLNELHKVLFVSDFHLVEGNVIVTSEMTKLMYQHRVRFMNGKPLVPSKKNTDAMNYKMFQRKQMSETIAVESFSQGATFSGKVRLQSEEDTDVLQLFNLLLDSECNFNYIAAYEKITNRLKERIIKKYEFKNNKHLKKSNANKLKLDYRAFYGPPKECQQYIKGEVNKLFKEKVIYTINFNQKDSTNRFHEIVIGNITIVVPHLGNTYTFFKDELKYLSEQIGEDLVYCIGGNRGYHSAFELEKNETNNRDGSVYQYNENGLWQLNDQFIGYVTMEVE